MNNSTFFALMVMLIFIGVPAIVLIDILLGVCDGLKRDLDIEKHNNLILSKNRWYKRWMGTPCSWCEYFIEVTEDTGPAPKGD